MRKLIIMLKGGKRRREGEVWMTPKGKKMTKKNGKNIPYREPNAQPKGRKKKQASPATATAQPHADIRDPKHADEITHKYIAKNHFNHDDLHLKLMSGEYRREGVTPGDHASVAKYVNDDKDKYVEHSRNIYRRLAYMAELKNDPNAIYRLKEMLHRGNPMSKEFFHKITGVKLPDTNAGTNAAIDKYMTIKKRQRRQTHTPEGFSIPKNPPVKKAPEESQKPAKKKKITKKDRDFANRLGRDLGRFMTGR